MEDVGAVVLAAGASSRMGRPKQALRFGGLSLLRRASLAALEGGCSPVIAVTGAHAEISRAELNGLDVLEVFNSDWQTGIASSVRAGIQGLLATTPNPVAAVFLLCDQPLVTGDVISALIAAYRGTQKPIIASSYDGSLGVPALFDKNLFARLTRLEGRAGAKHVIEENVSIADFLPLPGGGLDVDTPDDFSHLVALHCESLA